MCEKGKCNWKIATPESYINCWSMQNVTLTYNDATYMTLSKCNLSQVASVHAEEWHCCIREQTVHDCLDRIL